MMRLWHELEEDLENERKRNASLAENTTKHEPWEAGALRRSEAVNAHFAQMVGYGTAALRGAIGHLRAGAARIALQDLERDLAEMERRWETKP